MRAGLIALMAILTMTSCISKKKFAELQETHDSLESLYLKSREDFTRCQRELESCNNELARLEKDVTYLRGQNDRLIGNIGDMAMLSQKEAENVEKSLEKINEKDLQITRLSEALTRKDSVTIALVTSLKGAIGNMDDEDIQISVEKGVVFVNISDRFLFRSGSYRVNSKAKDVLAKVAKIVEAKPEMEVLVEGHTDNVSYAKGELEDNWDLSAKRATSLVRMLHKEFKINPARLTAAGRGEHVPIASNDTAEGRSANRRTRIVIMPKLDQFYGMIEAELNKK